MFMYVKTPIYVALIRVAVLLVGKDYCGLFIKHIGLLRASPCRKAQDHEKLLKCHDYINFILKGILHFKLWLQNYTAHS